MKQIEIGGYKRISKQKARKLYNSGKDIFLCPVNLNPAGIMGAIKAIREEWYKTEIVNGFFSVVPRNDSFECLCNSFSYYNCINSETGKYIAFYTREER